jgi:hypothetical protein
MQQLMFSSFQVISKYNWLALEDELFDKLKKSPAASHIKTVKELNVDFIGKIMHYLR